MTRVCPSVCCFFLPHIRYPWQGGTPPWVPPPSDLDRGVLLPGVPHFGKSPCLTWRGGGLPHLRQEMEYLIRRCRYASCIHAGGLSCSKRFDLKQLQEFCVILLCLSGHFYFLDYILFGSYIFDILVSAFSFWAMAEVIQRREQNFDD